MRGVPPGVDVPGVQGGVLGHGSGQAHGVRHLGGVNGRHDGQAQQAVGSGGVRQRQLPDRRLSHSLPVRRPPPLRIGAKSLVD